MGTTYISPTGSGNKSGTDWANAATLSSLNKMIVKAGAGGTVQVLADAGSYLVSQAINLSAAGSIAAAVTIKGVDHNGAAMDAIIEGTRPAKYMIGGTGGNELFKLQSGAANLDFENFTVNNTGTVFRAAADVSNISIQHVDANNVARFFEDLAGGTAKTATVSGLILRDIAVSGFSEGVVRLQYDSHAVTIENVRGDSQGQDGEFAMGVHLDGTTHDVVIRRTTMSNATYTTGGEYWNGDGFATERGVHDILFEDTLASGNSDGGYDLKSSATTLIRAIARDNARNFRVWGDTTMIDAVGIDPHKRGGTGGQDQVWVAEGGRLKILGGSFSDSSAGTIVFENKGSVSFDATQAVAVTYASTAKLYVDRAVSGAMNLTRVPAGTILKSASEVIAPAMTAPPVAAEPPQPAADKASPTSMISDTPVSPALLPLHFVSAAADEKVAGTLTADTFFFDQSVKLGKDVVTGFGSNDLLLTAKALTDNNKDGLIGFGANGVLDLGNKSGTVAMPDVAGGLRYLGRVDGGYAYGEAATRLKGALEGKIGVADTLAGDAGDAKASLFLADTALGRDLGHDSLVRFGVKDVLVTTTRLDGTTVVGGKIAAGADGFAFGHDGIYLGSTTVTDAADHAVTTLEYDGDRVIGDAHYYVYSLAGSAAGLAQIGA